MLRHQKVLAISYKSVLRHVNKLTFMRRVARIRRGVASLSDVLRVGRELIVQQRFQDADEILQQGLKAFPDHPELLVQYAFSAHNSRRYDDAMVRWERARDKQPDFAMAWCGIAANARERSKITEASSVIAEALRRFPDDLNVIAEAARIADRRGASAEAIVLWKRMIEKPPIHPEWLQGYATNLVLLGRFDEAAVELDHSSALYPDHPGLLAVKGILAMAREDWNSALAVWRDFRGKFPDDQTGWELLGRTIMSKQLAEADEVCKTPTKSVTGFDVLFIRPTQQPHARRQTKVAFQLIEENSSHIKRECQFCLVCRTCRFRALESLKEVVACPERQHTEYRQFLGFRCHNPVENFVDRAIPAAREDMTHSLLHSVEC